MKRWKFPWIALAMAAGLLALAFGLSGQYAHLGAKHWRKQLSTVPDEHAAGLLAQVAELGEPGIPVLVEALGSERESVARAGKRVLGEQLDDWRLLRSQQSSPRLAALADALADRVDEFGPTARNDAADLATRILRWPLDAHVVDRSRVIASCEKVVRSTSAPGGRPLESSPAGQSSVGDIEPARDRRPRADDRIQPDESFADGSYPPGGGLPIHSDSGTQRPQRQVEIPRTADVRGAEPPLLADPSLAEPPHPLQTPDRLSIVPEEVRTVPEARKARDQQPQAAEPGPIRPLSLGGPDEASRRNVQGDLAEVETVDLMRCLRAEDEPTASRARTELTRRGFQAVHLELARRVFDPDPETRMRLARSLPALQGVDAIPWLLWLARDADAEVRLVAITLLATTGDPKLLEQVEHMARQDPDPRIRRRALDFAQRQRGKQY